MNRDDIIRMAWKAGFERLGHTDNDWVCYPEDIERFANLVASAEREACAKLLEQAAEAAKNADPQGFVWRAVKESAEAIRARGQA